MITYRFCSYSILKFEAPSRFKNANCIEFIQLVI